MFEKSVCVRGWAHLSSIDQIGCSSAQWPLSLADPLSICLNNLKYWARWTNELMNRLRDGIRSYAYIASQPTSNWFPLDFTLCPSLIRLKERTFRFKYSDTRMTFIYKQRYGSGKFISRIWLILVIALNAHCYRCSDLKGTHLWHYSSDKQMKYWYKSVFLVFENFWWIAGRKHEKSFKKCNESKKQFNSKSVVQVVTY